MTRLSNPTRQARRSKPFTVIFVLRPHFSLLAFTASADALTTANLVTGSGDFAFETLSLDDREVVSDLGIVLKTDHTYSASSAGADSSTPEADAIIVCGGYRCDMSECLGLTQLLQLADRKKGVLLGGIWNGAVALAHAGLLDGYAFTVHPASTSRMEKLFPDLMLRSDTFVIDRQRLSASGPNSAFDLMLLIIQRLHLADTAQAIRDILKADTPSADPSGSALLVPDTSIPDTLHTALQLMRSNLDEPLNKTELARYINLSTRAMERLFERCLGTSPAKHYMQLRLQRAHELLHQTEMPIAAISDACGFVSTAHFSRAFSRHYGRSPSQEKKSPGTLLRP